MSTKKQPDGMETQGPLPFEIYEVTKASKNLPVQRTSPDTIEVREVARLRTMLDRRQFDALNQALEGYQTSFEKDHRNEYIVYDAFRTFSTTLPFHEVLMNEWIAHSPKRYPPYLASALYYYAQAWESRGEKYAKDTPEENFRGMEVYLGKAAEAALTALEMNPNLFMTCIILTAVHNMTGMSEAEDEIFNHALSRFPHSFLIRVTYMWAKQPKWGGSYEIMESIAKGAETYADQNPRLSVLYGLIYAEQADVCKSYRKYDEAIELHTKALDFGDH